MKADIDQLRTQGRGHRGARVALPLLLASVAMLAACGADAGPTPPVTTPPAPAPIVGDVVPATLTAGAAAPVTLVVRGQHFTTRSVVEWNGAARPTEYASATELRVRVNGTDVETAGAAFVRVRTPAPTNGVSAPFTVTISDPLIEAPTITRLMPDRILAGTATNVVVAIIGTNFTPSTRVRVNGADRDVDYFGPTTLRVILTPTDYAQAQALRLTVTTPAPGGGTADAFVTVYAIPVTRIDLLDAAGPFGANWSWVGWPLLYQATPRSAAGEALPQRAVQWSTSTPTLLTLAPESDNYVKVYGTSAGTASLSASVGDVITSQTVRLFDPPPFDVVYVAGSSTQMHLRLWQPHTGNAAQTIVGNLTVTSPAPSPDGEFIAFSGSVKTDAPVVPAPDIYVVRRDGTGLRQLTNGEAADFEPSWSPDGQRIAFTSSRANGTLDVWTMDVNGGSLRQLTQSRVTAPVAGSGTSASSAAWSPDGQTLAYVVGADFRVQLWRMRADGSDKRQLFASATDNALLPTWSPDGRYIVFTQQRIPATMTMLSAVSPDGQTAFPFGLNPPPFAAHPAISPDGGWVLTGTNDPVNGSSMYIMPADGSRSQRAFITPELGGARQARWIRRVTTQAR